MGVKRKVGKLIRKSVVLLEKRARDDKPLKTSDEYEQQRTAAAYYCARAYMDFMDNTKLSEQWHRYAIDLEPDFLYSHVALLYHFFKVQRYEDALKLALEAE